MYQNKKSDKKNKFLINCVQHFTDSLTYTGTNECCGVNRYNKNLSRYVSFFFSNQIVINQYTDNTVHS